MGHACTHDHFPGPDKEHPVVAVLAIIAIVAAMLLIAWARLEVHGTEDLEAALVEPSSRRRAGAPSPTSSRSAKSTRRYLEPFRHRLLALSAAAA